jgi:hypothetical protein
MRRFLVLLTTLCFAAGLPAQEMPQSAPKRYFPACASFGSEYSFDCYHDYAETTRFLRDAAAAYPELTTLSSMGKSWQGRELWVLTISDPAGGPADEKPAIWIDGGIDADEVVAIEAALGVVHRLLTSDDPEIAALRRSRTFYVAPAVIPDASDLHMTSDERPRDTTLRPWDDDGDGRLDEDGPEDLDGDGQALTMRRQGPRGELAASEEDPRLMRPRRPGDAGPFYETWTEGIDNDGDGEYQEDRLGGVDPNRNYPGRWSVEQRGSGPFAGSEHEIRALIDFAAGHPNIAASQHFHSSGGVVLRPPSVPDWDLPSSDEQLYLRMAERGLEVTGYELATSVYDWNWPRGSGNRKKGQIWRDSGGELAGGPSRLDGYAAFGGSIDALYEVFGVLAFANEIFQLGEDEDGDGQVEQHEALAWDDEHQGGEGFKEWEAFEHPQLGAVEIGGWRKFGQNNPLADRLPEEVRRNVEFVLMQARHMATLAIEELEVVAVGGEVYRVEATVANHGFVPTELAIRAEQGRGVPVRASVGGDGVEVLSSEARVDLGTIAGHGEAEVEWVVRAPSAGAIEVTAWHPKAGRASRKVTAAD